MDVLVLGSRPLSAASSALCPWTLGALHRDIAIGGLSVGDFSSGGLSIGDLSIGDLSIGGHCCKVLSFMRTGSQLHNNSRPSLCLSCFAKPNACGLQNVRETPSAPHHPIQTISFAFGFPESSQMCNTYLYQVLQAVTRGQDLHHIIKSFHLDQKLEQL